MDSSSSSSSSSSRSRGENSEEGSVVKNWRDAIRKEGGEEEEEKGDFA